MHDANQDEADRRLAALFDDHLAPPEDDGFSQRVLQRIEREGARRSRLERLALPVAAAVAGALAAGPVLAYVAGTGVDLAAILAHITDAAWIADRRALVTGVLIGAVSLLYTQFLED